MPPDVWVTGIGIVSALGEGVPVHVRAVREGHSGLAPREFFGGAVPDPVMCGMIPPEAMRETVEATPADRADRILRRATAAALTDAGITVSNGVEAIAGTTLGNMHGATCYHRQLREGRNVDPALLGGFILASPLRSVCRSLGITGRVLTISSACGSATAALGEAFHRIRSGASRCVVAGGFEAVSPYVVAGFNSLRLVSRHMCRPFDRSRSGLNPGEGAAMLVCEEAGAARARGARPLARIAGSGAALDAYHYTRAHPEGRGLAQAMRAALSSAKMPPDAIDHLHLHGTGTDANDPSEYHACRDVFGDRLSAVPAASTKPLTGHTFGASGALNAVFSIIALREKLAPGTISLVEQDPLFSGLNLARDAREAPGLKTAMSLSLGFGGESSAVVLTEAAT